MKQFSLRIILLSIIPLLVSWGSADFAATPVASTPTHANYKTKYHIIVVIDGPRWSETWGDSTYQYIPNLAHSLKKEGTFYTHFTNEGKTLTNSSHAAMLTGHYQKLSNSGKQLPKRPTIFQYFNAQHGTTKEKTWIMTSKGKLEMLANTKNKEWWNKYMPSTYCGIGGLGVGYPNDRDMYPKYKELLLKHKPTMTIINFLDADAWAHQGNWEKYVGGIKELDGLVMDLYNTIQSDPEMKNQTAIYITNDHGRHLDGRKSGWHSHGCKCDGCKKIMLLAIGPDFKKGVEEHTPRELIDITATIAHMLQIDMPTSRGSVMQELFIRQ